MLVTVYLKPGCYLCEDVLDVLDRLTPRYGLEVRQVNILDDIATFQAYREQIPVVEAEGGRFGRLIAPIDEGELQAYLDMAHRERTAVPPAPRTSVVYDGRETRADRIASYIGRHWLRFVCITLGVFVGLAWSSAIFAALGWWDAANVVYTAYALTCHQLPERAGSILGYQVAFCFRNTALYAGC
jgi:glutaredoxin